MARELLHIGNDDGLLRFPCTAAHSPAVSDTRTCHRPLERTEDKLVAETFNRYKEKYEAKTSTAIMTPFLNCATG